jgi:alkylhydroperoxidase family enzyme
MVNTITSTTPGAPEAAHVVRYLWHVRELYSDDCVSADLTTEMDDLRSCMNKTDANLVDWLEARIEASIPKPEKVAPELPLFGTREAMRDAGLPDWEMGKGLSSADAIRELARQRDEARVRLREHEEDNVRLQMEWTRAAAERDELRDANQTQASAFKNRVKDLESELAQWREGEP